MNILDQLTIKQNPFGFTYTPEDIIMSDREISILPALVSELVDMSISSVKPLEGVGRVMIFDVQPHQRKDPPLIVCRDVNLKEYYFLWTQVVDRNRQYLENLLSLYDKMIHALNISKLQNDEAAYMLK